MVVSGSGFLSGPGGVSIIFGSATCKITAESDTQVQCTLTQALSVTFPVSCLVSHSLPHVLSLLSRPSPSLCLSHVLSLLSRLPLSLSRSLSLVSPLSPPLSFSLSCLASPSHSVSLTFSLSCLVPLTFSVSCLVSLSLSLTFSGSCPASPSRSHTHTHTHVLALLSRPPLLFSPHTPSVPCLVSLSHSQTFFVSYLVSLFHSLSLTFSVYCLAPLPLSHTPLPHSHRITHARSR